MGPLWALMGPYGPIGPIGPIWAHWAHMAPYGSIWAHMGPYGTIWFVLFLFGHRCGYSHHDFIFSPFPVRETVTADDAVMRTCLVPILPDPNYRVGRLVQPHVILVQPFADQTWGC